MKKQILTLTTTLAIGALVGCGGPKADQIDVASQIHAPSTVSQFQSNKNFDSTVADATIITFPQGKDLEGYEYAYNEVAFKTVMSRLQYGDQLPLEYNKDASSADKIAQVSTAILSLGKLKDMSYEKLKQAQFGVKATQAKVAPMIDQVLKNFPCYKLNDDKRACKLEADETTSDKPKYPKKCSELKRNKKKFKDHLTEEQDKAYSQGIAQCSALQAKVTEIQDLEEKVKTIRQMGRDIGVALVEDYSAHAKFRGLVVVNSKEKEEGDFTSKIVFNESKTKVETLSLGINFGNGYREFSIENGGISNVSYGQTKYGTTFLKLRINGDYRIDAELTVSSRTIVLHSSGATYTEVRLKGSTENHFPDGTVRKGVMSLQIDTL
ncbi:MAG: hypothetical protein CME70_23995 [Halobacteriovorax sp.]|nr:hypothetical protein [Halobacteriovorax sp.]|tara:strand:- start:16286 stop:17425 length:1140 start_codon:yes stop_codon:yes gene_type:complete